MSDEKDNSNYSVEVTSLKCIKFTNRNRKIFIIPLEEIATLLRLIKEKRNQFEESLKKNKIEVLEEEYKKCQDKLNQPTTSEQQKTKLENGMAANRDEYNQVTQQTKETYKCLYRYHEDVWRKVMGNFLSDQKENMPSLCSVIGSQTKSILNAVNYIVKWGERKQEPVLQEYDLNSNEVFLDADNLNTFFNSSGNFTITGAGDVLSLPKPFLLLAGISGTGKTRFVREQAVMAAKKYDLEEGVNFCLVPVRPDWHEPSDLLGYISRISGVRYVATDFLKFMILAWCHAAESADEDNIVLKNVDEIPPFWLCLDEMNLAPVEQYFADYLSVLETREWRGETKAYHCEALLKVGVFDELEGCTVLGEAENAFEVFWKSVCPPTEQNKELRDNLKQYFRKNGIPLPPNLIVAGTVNMDETTHGFSRKVIDRALTLDFQEFFPNNYDEFFSVENNGGMKMFSFPRITQVRPEDLKNSIDLKQTEIAQESVVENDSALPEPNGDEASGVKPEPDQNESEASSASVESRSVEFLKGLNGILKDTPFELGFRALNELLLSVVCMRPSDNQALLAVWDDFLMQKVLPRIEGDTQKLKSLHGTKVEGHDEGTYGSGSILHDLYSFLRSDEALREIWDKGRPDLLRGGQGDINCRTRKKLEWMMRRLRTRRSTDFWV